MLHSSPNKKSSWKKSFFNIKDSTLRIIFSKFAENSAYQTLKNISDMSGINLSEKELRMILQSTIVPAYYHGWLENVVTLNELQKWVEHRSALAFSDSLLDNIGLKQYFLMHCLRSAVLLDKISTIEMLEQCNESGFLYYDLISADTLEKWKPGSTTVIKYLLTLNKREGFLMYLKWLKEPDLIKLTIPNDIF